MKFLLILLITFEVRGQVNRFFGEWRSYRPGDYTKDFSCNCPFRCGAPNRDSRVVGGKITKRNEYPWIASLSYRGKLYCGATLLNDRYLLTAAHCIKGISRTSVKVVMGAYDNSNTGEDTRLELSIGNWWYHPNFQRSTFNNDIGVIMLTYPVEFSNYVRPVCLPEEDDVSYIGEMGLVAGWGRVGEKSDPSAFLREIRVPIMSNDECKQKSYQPYEITDNMMCAGYDQGKIDACQGDSGGPLLHETVNSVGQVTIEVIGIVSWGTGCARAGYPGVYTRLSKYMEFITTRITDGCFCPRTL